MKLGHRTLVNWLAGAVGAVVIAGLIERAVEQSALGLWIQETGVPALDGLVRATLASPWAFWAAWTLAPIALIMSCWELGRHFLGRPRWPTEKNTDLRLANQCEKQAEKLTEAAAQFRTFEEERNRNHLALLSAIGDEREKFAPIIRYEEAANKNMGVTHGAMIVTTALRPMFTLEFARRKIKIDKDEVNIARPEGMVAYARCLREVASALREGRYKRKTFTCRLQAAKGPTAINAS